MSLPWKDVVVVGAGLTGLTLARRLSLNGVDYSLLESSDRVGGVIRTHREDGFVWEEGPNTGVLSTPEAAELFEELSDRCRMKPASEKAAKRYVYKRGQIHPLPSSLSGFVKTPLFDTGDKWGLLLEPFRSKGKDANESLADLVRRRLGQSFLDYAIDPFILGIYAGDPAVLIPKYAFPKLYRLEQHYGSFINGAFRKKMEGKTEREKKATRKIFSFEGGLSSLVNALFADIGEERLEKGIVELKATVLPSGGFRLEGKRKNGDTYACRCGQLALCCGARATADILHQEDAHVRGCFSDLPHAPVVQASIGYHRWSGRPLDGFGALVPFREKMDILGALFISSCWQGRAPEGGALLSIFLGGVRRPEIIEKSQDELAEMTLRSVREMLGEEADPRFLRFTRHPYAIPQYGRESVERVRVIERLQNSRHGLHIASNVCEGIGMADRIRQAEKKAKKITENYRSGDFHFNHAE